MGKFDLEDVWRRRHPENREFSWCRGQKCSRIDYWLISQSLDNQVDDVSYKISAFSDHRCVELKLRMSETSHGMGVWKMNVDVIQSPTFQKVFTNWWKHWQTKKSQYPNVGVWWEVADEKDKIIVY
jgi:hypothetical protein